PPKYTNYPYTPLFRSRLRGEEHVWTPETIGTLQHAVRSGNYRQFKSYTAKVNDQVSKLKNLRGLFELKPVGKPVPLDEVEPASEDRKSTRLNSSHVKN